MHSGPMNFRSNNAVDDRLKILGEHHPELPRTARTLLGTCENVNLDMKSGMQYFYFGCKEQLCRYLNMYPSDVVTQLDCLDISLNIDGLPLFKSSSQSLWPVLCKINLAPSTVFPLALCFDDSQILIFLTDVVHDLRDILLNGLETDRGHLQVHFRCITCDAPARALVSSRLLGLRQFMPNLFARKPRGLQDIDQWKATELRQFALYTRKIVLKGVLSDDLYAHFMLFSVALAILVCPQLVKQYSSFASDLLVHFVEEGRKLYEDKLLLMHMRTVG